MSSGPPSFNHAQEFGSRKGIKERSIDRGEKEFGTGRGFSYGGVGSEEKDASWKINKKDGVGDENRMMGQKNVRIVPTVVRDGESTGIDRSKQGIWRSHVRITENGIKDTGEGNTSLLGASEGLRHRHASNSGTKDSKPSLLSISDHKRYNNPSKPISTYESKLREKLQQKIIHLDIDASDDSEKEVTNNSFKSFKETESREQLKQQMTELLTKQRKKYESKKGISDDIVSTNDKTEQEDDETEPPEKPFGDNKNIHTVHSVF